MARGRGGSRETDRADQQELTQRARGVAIVDDRWSRAPGAIAAAGDEADDSPGELIATVERQLVRLQSQQR